MKRARAVYRTLLYGYPAPFRQEYGDQMSLIFVEQLEEARRTGSRRDEAVLWMRAVRDIVTVAPKEHWHIIAQDLHYAFRMMAAQRGFTVVAILSLALGIGANTAIFSLWNRVLRTPLPLVTESDRLVMLTNPGSSGMWRGAWDSLAGGQRRWVTYTEFEQLRDDASTFEAVMASQASLTTWQVRVDGDTPEEVRGRLVSGGFFQVLGVRPALGRMFTSTEDSGSTEPAVAVISDAYWQRRFGRRPDAIGRTLTMHDTTVAIIGVAPNGFIGESSGQRPDVWLPLRLQPGVIPGANWLRDQPPNDKVMWLHVFGRLKPGVSQAHAEADANRVFRAHLNAFFADSDLARRRDVVEQHLRLQSGARGASVTLDQFSSSLTILLAAVGTLLLITCANLANLLLARSVTRQGEIAVRLSLGASRGRLIRQLVTESLALAALGGLVGLAVGYALHPILVRMLQALDSKLFVEFDFSPAVMAFVLVVSVACAIACGVLPAWHMSRSDAGEYLKDNSRGALGSRPALRSSRWLVGLQLALSLPLLVGAGLLVRSAYNLQHPDLGFAADRLILAQVGLGDLMQDIPRRDRVLRDLVARLEQIPAVEAASFSQLGLLSAAASTATIEVDGNHGIGDQPPEIYLDRVGASYFSTLRISILRGRDFSRADRADSQKVCIVNAKFVERFFGRRNPIGASVTIVGNDGVRTAYEVVGVAADAHTHDWLGPVEPRFFVPAEQRLSLGSARTFLIRTRSDPTSVMMAVREAIGSVDPAISLTSIQSMDEHVASLTAEDDSIARLAGVFGVVAIALAAIGLYGVLSYGVTRRSKEIAIRIALGARSRGVVGLILRESLFIVAGGLVAGSVLAYAGSRLIEARLYGVASRDPLTFIAAFGALLVVALTAAWLPARRASRVDPMRVLHEG